MGHFFDWQFLLSGGDDARYSARCSCGYLSNRIAPPRLLGWVVAMKMALTELTDNEIKTLLQRYFQQLLEEDERGRALEKKSWRDKQYLGDHADAMAYLQHDCRRELAIGNHSRAIGAVDRLLAEHGIKLDRDGLSYRTLCREMMKVMINHLEIDIRRTRLDHSLENLPFPEIVEKEGKG